MILLIDNYDSFVHNLARYVGKLGKKRQVVRHDAITLADITRDPPEAIIISPGPCTPHEAGISNAVIQKFSGRIPILGVCLGHQCIGEVFGGRTSPAPHPVHGQTSLITHNSDDLFSGRPHPLEVARYHSLIVDLPADSPLEITARTKDKDAIIMALQHKTHPTFGIQFHPESILTPHGIDIIKNFISLTDQWNENNRHRGDTNSCSFNN